MDYKLIKENFERSMKEEQMAVRPELGTMAGEMIEKAIRKKIGNDPNGLFRKMEILVDADFPGGEAWKKALMDELSKSRTFVAPPSNLKRGVAITALLRGDKLKVVFGLGDDVGTMFTKDFEMKLDRGKVPPDISKFTQTLKEKKMPAKEIVVAGLRAFAKFIDKKTRKKGTGALLVKSLGNEALYGLAQSLEGMMTPKE